MNVPIGVLCLASLPVLFATQDAPPSVPIGEHSAPIEQLAVSLDGKLLFTAAKGQVHAWDLSERELVWQAAVHDAPIVAFGVSEDRVAYNYGVGAALFLETETGETQDAVSVFPPNQPSTCLAMDPGDRWVWVGLEKGVSRLNPKDVNSWSYRVLENSGTTCFAMDAKGKHLAVGGQDGTVRFVGATSANVDDKKIFEGHEQAISALAFDPKGSLLVSGAENGELRVWKFSSGKCQAVLSRHANRIEHLACDPKSKRFASGDATGLVLLWSLRSDDPPVTIAPSSGKAVTGLAFADKGQTLVTAGGSGQATLWDVSDL